MSRAKHSDETTRLAIAFIGMRVALLRVTALADALSALLQQLRGCQLNQDELEELVRLIGALGREGLAATVASEPRHDGPQRQ